MQKALDDELMEDDMLPLLAGSCVDHWGQLLHEHTTETATLLLLSVDICSYLFWVLVFLGSPW